MTLEVSIGQCSITGPRPRNEDFVGAVTPTGETLDAKGVLLAVADGVGGHAKGREAAEFTVRGLLNDYYATPDTWRIAQAIDQVLGALNRWLVAHAARTRESAGMATTLSALVLRGTRWHLAHVGDSRIYLYRDDRLTQLTEDHTWAHPELSNVLHRAVGLDARLAVDHADGELEVGDTFVLMSDGVWNTLRDDGIAALLARSGDAESLASTLVLQAEARGANDNCTALVARVDALPQAALRDRLAEAAGLSLPPRLAIGEELDGLRVEAVLHESRLTLLYRVTDLTSGEAHVLKTLREDADPDAVAALVHEEWLARRVVSPQFPQVIGHPRSRLYYLMSWHDGASLRARLDAGHHFGCEQVVKLGCSVLRALGTLHRLGIVHRDIKPDNLHLDSQGTLRVLDLGVAASDGEDFKEINNPGTPSYMAPELFAGEAASESSDLFALGVTLYQLLTRHYPWGEIEPFQRPRFGEPVPPTRYRPDVPEWLEAVLLKAIARSPEARFETAEEFLLALERGAHRPLALPRRAPLVERMSVRLLRVLLVVSLLFNILLLCALLR
ncbi:bifunctional protein-serine/threonine kinase/phosphatase [Methyloversatilis discipulorum]|uniref:bifunctional protein-serine/threonine kinase/phosphatase n=1 Tax=Methyloversatilis discipulorum TaxID=1119528 RepID=UPI001A470AF8|nr:bifunctional protein-serine/threonine kinase/phosphatase [Methyloversatilis discipulorum]MBL8469434.1 bifunctional protein-serine/threonine kinase/phosphatase [Methyloversatilis discipulorum]